MSVTEPLRNVIVADIDGCCVFSEHRIPFLLEGDEDTYHQNHIYDKPIAPGVAVYQKFITDPAYRFYFVTARTEDARAYTLRQLRTWVHPDIKDSQLLMRPKSATPDVVPAVKLKPALLREIGIEPRHIFLVFEDQTSMVKAWRKQGVVVYQTAFGDF